MADQTGRAPDRTDLASDRTTLANERTLAAWWRTAMAALASGVAFARLYGDVEPRWLVRGGATVLIVLALVILGLAFRRYRRTARRMDHPKVERLSTAALSTATLLLGLAAVVAGATVWLL